MEPRICEGTPLGSLIMLKTIQSPTCWPPALWLNFNVVALPTLKLCQVRTAWDAVWSTVTTVRPLEVISVGSFAPDQRLEPAVAPAAGFRPPIPNPLGTLGNCWEGLFGLAPRLFFPALAAMRWALLCMDRTASTARVARERASRAFARAALTEGGVKEVGFEERPGLPV